MEDWKHTPARDHDLPLFESLGSTRRESGLLFRISHLVTWSLLRSWLKLAHRFHITGRENIPASGSFVIVANHSSHLDTVALASALPPSQRARVVPVAAGDLFFATKGRSVAASLALNALPMWRKAGTAHALRDLRVRLQESSAILILFPEGTRSRDGHMADFKPGIGMVVAGTDVNVIPCHLSGCFDALPSGRRCPRFTRITLTIGQPQTFSDISNDRDGWQAVASHLEETVRNLKPASP